MLSRDGHRGKGGMMENEIVRYVNLGYVNGWKETPKIVSVCRGKVHPREYEGAGRCVERVRCAVCGYEYFIDSGD